MLPGFAPLLLQSGRGRGADAPHRQHGSASAGASGAGCPAIETSCAAAERSGPGALTHLTNSMLLQALAGTRRVLGAAAWATCTLLGSRADNRFPLSIRVHSGEEVVLSVVRPGCLVVMPYPP